jgi:hypothetical protein
LPLGIEHGQKVPEAGPVKLTGEFKRRLALLKIDKAILAGFDWGARSADIIAAARRERISPKRPVGTCRSST